MLNQVIIWVCFAVLTLSIGYFYLPTKVESPDRKEALLNMSLREYQAAEEKLTEMTGKASPDQKIFLKNLKTVSDISVSEGIKKADLGKYLDETFRSGAWSESHQGIMRRLEFANNARGSSELNCDLDVERTCQMSELRVIAKHYEDEEKTERMDIYYSYTKVEFKFDDLNKNEDGVFTRMLGNFAKWSGVVAEAKIDHGVIIKLLGQFFLEYISAEQDKAFYGKVIDSINPFKKNSEPKQITSGLNRRPAQIGTVPRNV